MEFLEEVELADKQATNVAGEQATSVSAARSSLIERTAQEVVQTPTPLEEIEPTAAQAEPVSPGFTAAWHRLWRTWLVATTACQLREEDVKEVFGYSPTLCSPRPPREIRGALVRAVIAKAQQAFSLPGETLSISEDSVKRALGPVAGAFPTVDRHLWDFDVRFSFTRGHEALENECAAAFDPDAVWGHLEQQYGGDARQKRLYQQAAEALFRHLSLAKQPPGEKMGRMLVSVGVRSDKLAEGSVYVDSSVQMLQHIRSGLEVVAQWAGDVATASALKNKDVPALKKSGVIVSRSAHRFGSIEWVFFVGKVDILFNEDFGVKFRRFIAEHAPRPGQGR